jgi:hypothetical protein
MAEVIYADLDIGLMRDREEHRYRVQAQFWPVDDDARQPPAFGAATLDPDDFVGLAGGAAAHGKLLAERLFESAAVLDAFKVARERTYRRAGAPSGLRVRLWLGPGAEDLYGLRWEALADPLDDQFTLATQDSIPFSRFLGSRDGRPVRLRPKGELRALVAIAAPTNLADAELMDVNVEAEWARVRAAMQGLATPPRLLAAHADATGRATWPRMLEEIGRGVDIVYIVCHGSLDGEPFLLLERDDGTAEGVRGADLAEALRGLEQPPRLVVLTACQSAGTGHSTDNSSHVALGPELVKVGTPAVLAMNGKVPMDAAAAFLSRFFTQLFDHGCVDRAMSAARREVKAQGIDEWWMPVLYMRLSAGRIWSVLRVVDRNEDPWEELSLSLTNQQCAPALGPGLLEPLWGSPREVARSWADERGFPLAPHGYDDLALVAQYLARRRDGRPNRALVRQKWIETLTAGLGRRWPDLVADRDDLAGLRPPVRLARLSAEAGERLRQHELDPHRLLARLPVSVYLTATPDPLLVDALAAADRPPVVEYARWTDKLRAAPRRFDETDKKLIISPERPLVFHLFGTLDDLDSLVITEDDYFDYLISVVTDRDGLVIPNRVRTAWSTDALLFLGFDLDEWAFRVLYRAILHEEGHKYRLDQGTLSVAVQLNPDENRNLRPDSALQFLEQVFGSEKISLYWTQPEDFLQQVWRRLPAGGGGQL